MNETSVSDSSPPEQPPLVPDRMTEARAWRDQKMPHELWLDDREGDGMLIGVSQAGEIPLADIRYSGAALTKLKWAWTEPCVLRPADEATVEMRIRAALAERHARS